MNKKLDFIGLEKKIIGGAKRYVPRFYESPKYNVVKMTYCGNDYYYDTVKHAFVNDEYNEVTALSIFGFIVINLKYNNSFTIPDNVKEAINTLHKTDRKKRVEVAENLIFKWFKNTAEQFDSSTSKHYYFRETPYYGPYIEDYCNKNNSNNKTITTHLLGSLYSRRFGAHTLENGQVVDVRHTVYNDNYWKEKRPASNIDITEQKISNFMLIRKNVFYDRTDEKTVIYNCSNVLEWKVTFNDSGADFYTEEKSVDALYVKSCVLEAACFLDSYKFLSVYTRALPYYDIPQAAYWCDRFYYECVKQNPDSIVARDEIKVTVHADLVDDDKKDTKDDTKEEVKKDISDIGMEITLTADGARNGEYDLGKMFGLSFTKKPLDRDFLKNVSITKQHLSLVNKVIQSVYRIKEREKKGITDLGQLIGADFINVNFIGEPGTGKSFGLKIVSAILGIPLYIETFSGDSDTDKFQGTNTISKGSPTFEWTSVPTAHKEGGFCALEEVNQMRPDKTMAMSQALVDPFLLKVDNTMDVYRSPYTFYINLFNVGTEGSKPFNEAYINRFGYTYDFCEDTEEIERKQLHLMLGYEIENNDEVESITFSPRHLTDKDFEMAVSLKKRVIDYLTGDTVARDEEAKTISKRQCKEFLIEIQNGLDSKTASIGTFVNTLKCVDRELAEEVKRNVIDVFPFDNYR